MTLRHTHSFQSASRALRVYSGEDALAQLPAELERAGARRALLLCGRSVHEQSDLVGRVEALAQGRIVGVFHRVTAGASRQQVEAAAAMACKLEADALVAIGAGSVTKAARAIAIRVAESGPLESLATRYDEAGRSLPVRLNASKLPIFNVLTAATSSQNRAGASIRDEATGVQLEFFDPKTRPRAVFWDARALLSAPASLTRATAGMEYWWAIMGLAGAADENALVLASRRQCWAIAQSLLPRIEDPQDWRVRVELCACALLRTRDEDDGGAPLGVTGAAREVRMHPIVRATYALTQGVINSESAITQPQATLALAGPVVRAFGDLCPAVVRDMAGLLGAGDTSVESVATALTRQLNKVVGLKPELRSKLAHERIDAVLNRALRTFNSNADGWLNARVDRLRAAVEDVLRPDRSEEVDTHAAMDVAIGRKADA